MDRAVLQPGADPLDHRLPHPTPGQDPLQTTAPPRRIKRKCRTSRGHSTLIMVGSTATTTVAALDSGDKLTWQNVTIVTISFAITLAAAFTGYYKYRERSYFLQQTADAIEEEANAFALGVGKYGVYGPEKDQEALAVFTLAVEDLRNEQRRRQQQLDQPAEQATSGGTPPA
ncbi:DUF4231 domain-containing protein [Streptomyces sp. NPDC048179]|uniref:DUF4231 domain-containing protein n=1 Tax=Streptomyces sp. NPDC048179 TaxID=3365506 RepID=UPI0037126609